MIEFIQINPVDNSGILEFIDSQMLEKKYGGGFEDLEEYWPPRCVQDATKTVDENSFLQYGMIPFTYNPVEYETFLNNQQMQLKL